MKTTMEAQTYNLTSKEDLHSLIQQDLSETFYNSGLNELANPSDIGLARMGAMTDHLSSDRRVDEHVLGSDSKSYLDHGFKTLLPVASPSKSTTSRGGEDANVFGFGQNSVFCSPFKSDFKSKENNYHLNNLRSGFKNCADFQDEEIFLPNYEEESLGLLWDEPVFARNPPEGDFVPQSTMARNLEKDYEESNFDLDYNFQNSTATFLHQKLPKYKSDLDGILERKENLDMSATFEMSQHHESTRDTRFTMNQNIRRPSKEINIFDQGMSCPFDEYSQDTLTDAKGRPSRGLRVLSLRVKEVVSEFGKTTYKQVSDYITDQVNKSFKPEDSKEILNVKRRVYDALNVLVASNILIKNGKEISSAENTENIGFIKKKQLETNKQEVEKRNEFLKNKVREKQKALQEMTYKFLAIKNLIRRNQETVEKGKEEDNKFELDDQNTQSSTWSMNEVGEKSNEKTTNTVPFPFLIVGGSSAENSMNLYMDKTKTKASIESKAQLNVFGDTDVLFKLKLHFVSRDFFEEVLPDGMAKFIPSAYRDGLK